MNIWVDRYYELDVKLDEEIEGGKRWEDFGIWKYSTWVWGLINETWMWS